MVWSTIFANLAAGNQPLSLFDTMFAQVASLSAIPCTAASNNAISLTGLSNAPTLTAYTRYVMFRFRAAGTSTGAVTINFGGIGALNAYKADGATQVGANDILSGQEYLVVYDSALNAGAGGFFLENQAAANGVFNGISLTGNLQFLTDGAGIIDNNGNNLVTFGRATSAVNFVSIFNTATGNAPVIAANGSDTNISLGIQTKGTGAISFLSASGARIAAQILDVASAVNFLQIQNAITTSFPFLVAAGSDTNIGISFAAKGNGSFFFDHGGGARISFIISDAASAVNSLQTFSSATGISPSITSQGSDTNINTLISAKGTGGVRLKGTGTNNTAATGEVGEIFSNNAATVSLVTGTAKTVVSLTLTAGDWDVWGQVTFNPAGTTTMSALSASVSATTNTLDGACIFSIQGNAFSTGNQQFFPAGNMRQVQLSGSTTYFLVASASFAVSTMTADGIIFARRRR